MNDEENLTLHQKSLKALFHTPLQLTSLNPMCNSSTVESVLDKIVYNLLYWLRFSDDDDNNDDSMY